MSATQLHAAGPGPALLTSQADLPYRAEFTVHGHLSGTDSTGDLHLTLQLPVLKEILSPFQDKQAIRTRTVDYLQVEPEAGPSGCVSAKNTETSPKSGHRPKTSECLHWRRQKTLANPAYGMHVGSSSDITPAAHRVPHSPAETRSKSAFVRSSTGLTKEWQSLDARTVRGLLATSKARGGSLSQSRLSTAETRAVTRSGNLREGSVGATPRPVLEAEMSEALRHTLGEALSQALGNIPEMSEQQRKAILRSQDLHICAAMADADAMEAEGVLSTHRQEAQELRVAVEDRKSVV